MKKQLLLPLVSVAGGAAALVLRLLQNKTGFEEATGLPIPGNVPGLALAALLVVLALALASLAHLLPREQEDGPFFPEDFRTTGTGLVTLLIAGIFLMAVAGVLEMAVGGILMNLSGEAPGGADGPSVLFSTWGPGLAVSPKARLIMGVLALASAASLFPAAVSCKRRPGVRPRSASPALLLVPPVCMVARLVLAYRVDSVNPALQAYYVEILALTFLTLAFYRLASFAYHAARTRRFALYAGAAVALCLAASADADGLPSVLFYIGAALTLLALLLLWLAEGRDVSEIVENGGPAI